MHDAHRVCEAHVGEVANKEVNEKISRPVVLNCRHRMLVIRSSHLVPNSLVVPSSACLFPLTSPLPTSRLTFS